MIVINRNKAEELLRDRLRLEREPRLAELDLVYMRTLEVGGDTAAIVAEKEALRGVTEKDLSGLSLAELASLSLSVALTL